MREGDQQVLVTPGVPLLEQREDGDLGAGGGQGGKDQRVILWMGVRDLRVMFTYACGWVLGT